jgi:hypothetical protein
MPAVMTNQTRHVVQTLHRNTAVYYQGHSLMIPVTKHKCGLSSATGNLPANYKEILSGSDGTF